MSFWGGIGAVVGGIGGALLGGPAGAIAGASILGGVGGSVDAAEQTAATNAANRDIAKDQMAFQERMSSTAHQREVEDLKKAGLNPILSANAGASSPSGAGATMVSPDLQRSTEGIVSGVKDAMQMKLNLAKQASDINLQESQRKNLDMDTKTKSRLVPEADIKNKMYRAAEPAIDWLIEKAGTGALKKKINLNQGR